MSKAEEYFISEMKSKGITQINECTSFRYDEVIKLMQSFADEQLKEVKEEIKDLRFTLSVSHIEKQDLYESIKDSLYTDEEISKKYISSGYDSKSELIAQASRMASRNQRDRTLKALNQQDNE